MKILLDECLPQDLRHHFPEHEVHTVEWAGMKGLKNGQLLLAMETAGYDVLLTIDQGLQHQQRITGRKIAIVAVRCRSNQLRDLLPRVAEIIKALASTTRGSVFTV